MRSNLVKRLVTKTIVAVTLLFSAWAFIGTTAEAQSRGWHGQGGFHGGFSGRGFSGGFRGGFQRPGRVFVQPRSRVFVQPRAFVFPRTRVFVSPRVFVGPRFYPYYSGVYPSYYYGGGAYLDQQGYNDGYVRGRDDARHGDSYDPYRHSHYRDAGSVVYRDAFVRGYDVGFREYAD